MNLLKKYFLYTLSLGIGLLAGCEEENENILSRRDAVSDQVLVDPNLQDPDLPNKITPTVIKKDFAQATGWRIVWNGKLEAYDSEDEYPAFFSTINGSLHSKRFLDATDPGNTAIINMSLIYGFVSSPESEFIGNIPKYADQANKTKFKRTGMTAVEFADYAQNNPAMYQTLFESDPYLESDYQPSREDPGYELSSWYENGEIYTFKIESTPPKFGAVRIVDVGSPWNDQANNPIIIEVVVQKQASRRFAPQSR